MRPLLVQHRGSFAFLNEGGVTIMTPCERSSSVRRWQVAAVVLALLATGGAARSLQVNDDLDPVFDVRDSSDKCPDCQGHGRIACIACDGNGLNPALTSQHVPEATNHLIAVDCPRCHGASREPCLTCFGSARAGRCKE
jgi:hypothetical protein